MRGQLQPGAPPAAGCPESRESRRGRRARRGAPGCTSAPPGRHPAPLGLYSPANDAFAHLAPRPPSHTAAGESRPRTILKRCQPLAGSSWAPKGLITVLHAREDLCSSGSSVKKANPSEFSYRPRETPSDPRPSRREEEGSARERGPAAAAAL